jgi:transmembrane sensor
MAMRKVERPIRQHLQTDEEAALVARVWQRLDDRRPGQQRRRWIWASALLLLVFSGALYGLNERRRVALGRQPLTLRSDTPLGLIEAPANAPAQLQMSDGSEILLSAGGRMKTLQNGDGVLELALQQGRAELEVRPGGPRHWVIDADLVSVEVVGTHFSVARDAQGVGVSVERGVVLVRGERVPDRVQKLTAGQSLRVDSVPSPSPPSQPIAVAGSGVKFAPTPPAVKADVPAIKADVPAVKADVPAVERPAPRHVGSAAVAPVSASKTNATSLPHHPSTAQLLDQVDAARRAGQLDQAIAMLRKLAYDDSSPTAAIAAFTLGRVLLDERAAPAQATLAFERALHIGLPAGLSADALSLCRQSLSRSGNAEHPADLSHDRCQ